MTETVFMQTFYRMRLGVSVGKPLRDSNKAKVGHEGKNMICIETEFLA